MNKMAGFTGSPGVGGVSAWAAEQGAVLETGALFPSYCPKAFSASRGF